MYLIRYKLSYQTYINLWKFSPNHSIFLLSSQKQGLLVMKIWLQKERIKHFEVKVIITWL